MKITTIYMKIIGRKFYDILAEYFLPLQHGIRTL